MVAETKVKITAETAQAQAAMRTFGQELTGITGKLSSLAGIAGTLGGALSITAFAGFIKSSIDAADNLNDLAQKTGTSVEALAGLKFAADQNGTSLEVVALAGEKLSENLVDKPALFKQFGVTAKDTTGAMIQLADVFAAMPDGVEKTALAVKLMGRSGEEMIPFMNRGSVALGAMVEEGQRYNTTSAEMAQRADQFNDDLSMLKARSGEAGIAIANDLLPPLNSLLATFIKFTSGEGLGKKADLPWLDDLLRSSGIKFAEYEVKVEEFLARITLGQVSERHRLAASEARANLERMTKEEMDAPLARAQAEFDAAFKSRKSLVQFNDGKGKSFLDALGGDGKGADKEEKKRLDAFVKDIEDAKKVIFDADPVAKMSDEWTRLLALQARVSQEVLSDDQISASFAKTFGGMNDEIMRAEAEKQKNIEEAFLASRETLADIAEENAKSMAKVTKDGDATFASLESAVRGWGSAFTDEMTRMVRTGKLDFSSLANSIIDDLIRIQMQKNITDPLLQYGGGVLDGLLGNMFGGPAPTGMAAFSPEQMAGPVMAPPSFDGGGYTGMGARSGGIDGRGGFLSVLHPNETVIDHTRPAQNAQPAQHTYYIDARGADPAAIGRLEATIRSLNGSIERRAVAAVADARMRGGSFSSVFG